MRLILRDDDLSYFTRPEHLEFFFSDIWDKQTIHFATIPKVYTGQNETPVDREYDNEYYWIGDNDELVTYLKEKINEGKAKIWQHGFTHKDYGDDFELERTDEEQMYHELKEGKKHLEATFDTEVDTLVPPHDRLSKAAVRAAERIGYDRICRGFAPLPREVQWINKQYLTSYAKLILLYLRHGRRLRYPKPLDMGSHAELFSYRIQDLSVEKIPELLDFHQDGTLCITTHYRTLNTVQRELLRLLIDKAS